MKMNMVVSECLVEESKERADVLVACESVMTPGRLDFPDRPCLGCGSKEHFSSVCYEKNIFKHRYGCFRFEEMPESDKKKIMAKLSSAQNGVIMKRPIWVWQKSGKFSEPPKPAAREQVVDIVMKNQMVDFMVVQETGSAPFAELPDRRATTLRLFWTDDFEEDDEPVEKSSFETATAATQLKFTGVPWTTGQGEGPDAEDHGVPSVDRGDGRFRRTGEGERGKPGQDRRLTFVG